MSASLEVLGPAVDPWVAGAVAVVLTLGTGLAWRRISWRGRGALLVVVGLACESALRREPPEFRDEPRVDLVLEAGGCETPHHTLQILEPTRLRFFVERPRVIALGGAFRIAWPGHPRELVVRANRLVDKPCETRCEDGASCFHGRCAHRVVDVLRPLEEATDDHVLHPRPAWVERSFAPTWDEGRRWWGSQSCVGCHRETPDPNVVAWFQRDVPPPSRLLERFDASHRLGACPLAKPFGEVSPFSAKSLELYLGATAQAVRGAYSSRVSVPREAFDPFDD
ncbi:MAG: hypothetical protein H6722_32725 [Sandaracinus sp.]|nr:hypothetical protein [Myxococcales bacterium]MCB9617221.1 hypothetical protein [Sandaracinus sp.]MCB9618469.1 hypothetical protein [Sandaracinus sp.]